MGATYDATLLATSELCRARFALGDASFALEADALLQDEEIEALITLFGYAEGVAQCCDALMSRFAQSPDEYKDEGGVDARWTERIKAWAALAKRLRGGEVQTGTEQVPTRFHAGAALTNPDMTEYR